jgi:hypothetical protein
MKLSLEPSPDAYPGQINWDYDRAEIIADGAVHAIGVCWDSSAPSRSS